MITYDYFTPPSILSPHSLTDVLDLTKSYVTNFEPLRHSKPYNLRHCFQNTAPIYLIHPELNVVKNIFTKTGGENSYDLMQYLLAMQPDKKTILQTQEFIHELSTHKQLYKDITSFVQTQPIFKESKLIKEYFGNITDTTIRLSTERARTFLENILRLQKHKPKSKSMHSLFSWAQHVLDDDLYKEIERKKEHEIHSRIISVAEPEFGYGLRYAKLKPNVNIEDFVDFFQPKIDHFVNTELPRDDPKRGKQLFIEYSNGYAHKLDEHITLLSRQNLTTVNDAITELLTTSLFTVTTQINHALAGANLVYYLKQQNIPCTFPQISSKENYISAKTLYPIRLLLNRTNISKEFLQQIGEDEPLPIDFTVDSKITQMEGPNKNGKTELLRTMYLATHFTNSGFPIPAKQYETSLFEGTHFFKFKKTPGTGGSELERDISTLRHELKNTYPKDLIFIDEVGDATNDATSTELGRRLFPPLLDRQNTLFITTHQKGFREVIQELKGKVYRPATEGKNPYQPILATGLTNYMPNEVLDKLGVTSKSITEELPKIRPKHSQKTFYEENEPDEFKEDLPF